jgi:hypothetical protein
MVRLASRLMLRITHSLTRQLEEQYIGTKGVMDFLVFNSCYNLTERSRPIIQSYLTQDTHCLVLFKEQSDQP